MKRFVRRIAASLFIRLFLTLLAALLPFVAALSAVTLAQLNAHLVRSQIDDMDLHLTRATQYVNQYVQTLKSILMQMAYDPALQDESPSAVRDALQRYADNAALHIAQLYLRMPDGEILCTEQVIFDTMDYQPPRLEGNRAERIWISGPYFSRMAQERAVALVLALPLEAGGTAELICEVNLRMLMRNIQATLGKYPSFALLTLDDQLIAYNINALRPDSNVTYFDVRMDEALLSQLRQVKLGQRTLDATPDGTRAEIQTSMGLVDGAPWKLIVLIRGDVLRTQIRLALRSLLVPFLWGLPALLLLCALIARGYTRPIRALSRRMDEAVSLEVAPSVAALGERADEMGKLSRSYIRMITRIADMQSREREAQAARNRLELRLLQSQIYPHFYGNTLGCIVLLLLNNRQEQALDALRQLIRILSYGADHLDDMVELSQELSFLEAYVQVHKLRKGDAFRYVCQVPPECMDVKIPKLLLQPFVENSLFHGFAQAGPDPQLTLSAQIQGDCLEIVVEDNGCGIAPDELLRIQRMDESPETPGRRRGIGIGNVAARMRLCYGPSFGIQILSQPGQGTRVVIRTPLIRDDEKTAAP